MKANEARAGEQQSRARSRLRGRSGSLARHACLLLALLVPVACQSSIQVGPQAVAGLTPSGTVDMNEVQVAYIGSGGGGSGTLYSRAGPIRSPSAALVSAASAHRRSAHMARSTS